MADATRVDARAQASFGRGVAQGIGVAVRTGAAPFVMGMRWASANRGRTAEVPARRWSLSLASKAALDEVFFASELVLADIVSRAGTQRFARELPDALALFGDRGWIDDPVRYHEDPPPLRRVRGDVRRGPLLAYRHIRFKSHYEPRVGEPGRERWLGYRENRTAHGWLLEHPGAPRPWLVCVPGYRMGHPLVDFTGFRARWLHRELGLNVAIPVMPLHGPRRHGWRGGDGFFSGDFVDTVHAQTQAVWDVRRLLGWIRERGAPAVGVYGVSLGGYTAALLACLESDIDCVVTGIPATDFLRLVRSHAPEFVLRLAKRVGFSLDDVEQLLRVVSPLVLAPQVPHDRRFVYGGLADQLVTPDHARDLWNHWDRPKVGWYEGSHVSFIWEKAVGSFLEDAFRRTGLLAS